MLTLLALIPIAMSLTLPLLGAAGGISDLEQERFRRSLGLASSLAIGSIALRSAFEGALFPMFICLLCACALAWFTEKRPMDPATGRPAQATALLSALAVFSLLQGPAIAAAIILAAIALLLTPMLSGLRRLTGTQAPLKAAVPEPEPLQPTPHVPASPAAPSLEIPSAAASRPPLPGMAAPRAEPPPGGYQRTRRPGAPGQQGDLPMGPLPGERTRGG